METIEIKLNKKTLIPMLALLTGALFGETYFIYFLSTLDSNNTMKILYIFLTASLIYAIYSPIKKFLKNEPVLTFSKSGIEINEKGEPISLLWLQVDWKIEKENDGGAHYLILETADDKRKINISWLDKSPIEIEKLLQTYKTK